MAAIDDLKAAVAAEDTVIDQSVTFLNGVPDLLQQAFNAGKAGNDADLATLQADSKAHTDALAAGLATATPATPAVPIGAP